MKDITFKSTLLLAVSLASMITYSNISHAELCAIDQIKSDCAPKCRIFNNAQPGYFPTGMIPSYAGRDLKDLTDSDLDHLRSDFVFCNATQSNNMMHGVPNAQFPAYLDKTIADLKMQRDAMNHRAPANPTQVALLACPVALDQIKKLQTLIDETKAQHLDPHSQEGMQATCRMMQSQMEIVDGYINDLQECKQNGIVGLQPIVQLSISANETTERQFHSACD